MKSICPFCGVGCGMEVLSVNNTIVGVKPDPEHIVSRGHLCGKGMVSYEPLTAWDRLYEPLIKTKNELERTSWDNALKTTYEKIREIQKKYGNDSVAFYGGCQNTLEEIFNFQKLARLLGTNNVDSCARICHDPSASALKQVMGIGAGATSVTKIPEANVIIVAGESVTDSHPVLTQYFLEAKKKGAKIVQIDPRNTRFSELVNLKLRIKPRSDIFLFNAVGNYLITNNLINNEFINERTENFEAYKSAVAKFTLDLAEKNTGIPKNDIINLAKLVAMDKVIFSWGLGLTQSTGTKGIKSYLSLPLLTGSIGKKGSGVIVYRGQTDVQGSGDLIKPDIFPNGEMNEANSEALSKLWGFKPPVCKGTSIPNAFYNNDKIKALFLMGYNPVNSLPEKSRIESFLNNLELLVVQDIFMTETAKYADIILPSAAWAEKEGSVSSMDRLVKWRYKIVDPPGHARPDYEIIADIAEYAGQHFSKKPEDIFEQLKQSVPLYKNLNIEDVKDYSKNSRYPDGEELLYQEHFNLPSGKAKFIPVDSPEYNDGLILITGRLVTRYNTDEVINRVPGMQEYEPRLWINKADAEKLKVEDDETVNLKSRSGQLKIKTRITDDVLPGTVFAYMHNADINYIVTADLDDETGTPKYKYTQVTIEK
ncbi:formate dehydrogenase subunit alpha [Ferroplasma sp.]|uniref:formate dehydrogenase subunit alpha n=1 Tax=Ferroplasma sp. TaxID=2591003 RepID=UPI00307DE273